MLLRHVAIPRGNRRVIKKECEVLDHEEDNDNL